MASLRSSASFAADTTQSPTPYSLALSSLVACVSTGPICAAVQGSVLHVTAGAEFLSVFASCFDFEDNIPKGYHVHHEYSSGHE